MITTVYITSDGTEFTDYNKAQAHDAKTSSQVAMYGWRGNKVNNIEEATIVFLKTREASNFFIDQAKVEGSSYNGIEEDDKGWFLWDEWDTKYHFLDDDMVSAISSAWQAENGATDETEKMD